MGHYCRICGREQFWVKGHKIHLPLQDMYGDLNIDQLARREPEIWESPRFGFGTVSQ